MPGGREGLGQIALPGQAYPALPEGAGFQHGHADARAEGEGFALAHAAPATHQAFGLGAEGLRAAGPAKALVGPGTFHNQGQRREQQKFHLAARAARTQQAGLQDARIVGDDQRILRQAVGQIAEHAVAQLRAGIGSALARQDQQTGRAPLFRGKLGDLLRRQIKTVTAQRKIRFVGNHGCGGPHCCARPVAGLVRARRRG